jgi:hypothetical protein
MAGHGRLTGKKPGKHHIAVCSTATKDDHPIRSGTNEGKSGECDKGPLKIALPALPEYRADIPKSYS